MTSPVARFRSFLDRDVPALGALVLDPISARMAETEGLECAYLGGGTLGYLKTWTEANLNLTEMVQAGVDIMAASSLPLVLDGAGGWGDPMHMHRTIAMAEAAGFAGIEIEDQLLPKRAHHHVDLEHLIPTELMVQKIEETVAARRNPDFVIIGRTNASRTDGLDEALRRAERYRAAGADMLLVLPKTPDEAEIIGERLEGPLFYMMPAGVASIGMSMEQLGRLGYKVVVDPVTPFYARQKALRLCYEALGQGRPDPTVGGEMGTEIKHVHDVINLERMLEVERRSVER
jgi:2-methylisocitrate lyase-like PEP mutase family enzyme